MATALADLYGLARMVLGDRDTAWQLHEDSAIKAALQAVLRFGDLPGYALSADGLYCDPALAAPKDLKLLVYRSVLLFYQNMPDSYSIRTRAVSESFGSFREFVAKIEEEISLLENGAALFSGWQTYHGWVQGMAGLDLVKELCDVSVSVPVQTITIH